MIKINLMPTKRKPTVAKPKVPKPKVAKVRIKVPWGTIIIGLILIGASLAVMSVINGRLDQQAEQIRFETADLNRKIAALKVDIRKIEEAKRVKGEVMQKIEIIRNLKEAQHGPVRMMAALSDSMPEGVWITDFRPESETVYSVSGMALNTKVLVQFIYALDASPYFHSIELLGLSRTVLPNFPLPLQSFSLKVNVKYEKE